MFFVPICDNALLFNILKNVMVKQKTHKRHDIRTHPSPSAMLDSATYKNKVEHGGSKKCGKERYSMHACNTSSIIKERVSSEINHALNLFEPFHCKYCCPIKTDKNKFLIQVFEHHTIQVFNTSI